MTWQVVGVPEWLSGMTRNHVGFARAGSNPAAHDVFKCCVFFLCLPWRFILFYFIYFLLFLWFGFTSMWFNTLVLEYLNFKKKKNEKKEGLGLISCEDTSFPVLSFLILTLLNGCFWLSFVLNGYFFSVFHDKEKKKKRKEKKRKKALGLSQVRILWFWSFEFPNFNCVKWVFWLSIVRRIFAVLGPKFQPLRARFFNVVLVRCLSVVKIHVDEKVLWKYVLWKYVLYCLNNENYYLNNTTK